MVVQKKVEDATKNEFSTIKQKYTMTITELERIASQVRRDIIRMVQGQEQSPNHR